jgi:hypothetical protein
MKAKNIITGNIYHITLGRNEVAGEVIEATENGWNVRLIASDKVIKVNNSERFLRKARMIPTINETQDETEPTVEITQKVEATPDAVDPQKKRGGIKGQMSGLDAAARVLAENNTEMNVRQIAEAAIERGYWSPGGATPHATISSGIQREIRDKGKKSRFVKVSKGLFAACNE